MRCVFHAMAGFLGRVDRETRCAFWAEEPVDHGSSARVAVCPPGRSRQPEARPVTMWIDLASPEHCDAGAASLTTIGTGDAPKEGALFLITGQV
jgi:hypothetical protein